jgi:hypothetical protein
LKEPPPVREAVFLIQSSIQGNIMEIPNMPALTFEQLRQWELGSLMLTPEQLVSAIHLQRTIIEATVELTSAV